MHASGEREREPLARPRGSATRRTEEIRIRLTSRPCRGPARRGGLVVAVPGLLEEAVGVVLDALRLGGGLPCVVAGSVLGARTRRRRRCRLEAALARDLVGAVGGGPLPPPPPPPRARRTPPPPAPPVAPA